MTGTGGVLERARGALSPWWLAVVATAVAVGFTAVVMPSLARGYHPPGTPDIIALEFAWRGARFREILLQWAGPLPGAIPALKTMLFPWDYLYPVAYSLALASTHAALRRGASPDRRDRAMVVIPGAAGLCDWVENGMHLWALRGVSAPADVQAATFPDLPVALASVAAGAKFALLAVALAAVLLAAAGRVVAARG